MTKPTERDQRIAKCMEENKSKSALEASQGYCAAFVDSMMAIERATERKTA